MMLCGRDLRVGGMAGSVCSVLRLGRQRVDAAESFCHCSEKSSAGCSAVRGA